MPFDLPTLQTEPEQRTGSPLSVRRPLLTIAIPTFNRAWELAGLLQVLEPQVAGLR